MPDYHRHDQLKQKPDSCHPFVDGNGWASRLLINLELVKDGYLPCVLPAIKRLEYYETLDTAHTRGNYDPFISFAGVVESGFKAYWHALGINL
jgi:hypothetical protein